jgi:hypothetical protein
MSKPLGTTPGLKEIVARLAILEILNLQSRGLDRREAAWIKSAYWRDAVVDYGSYQGEAQAFAEIVVAVLGKQYEMTQHFLGNTLSDIEGHAARTESYLTAHHQLITAQTEST